LGGWLEDVDTVSYTILIRVENCTFALAKEASSHPTSPGSSSPIVAGAGSDANLPSLALAKLAIFNPDEYILIRVENCTFALAKEASLHPTRLGSSYQ